jgi:predicted lipoprotein with Yx(FWY)xxD motif
MTSSMLTRLPMPVKIGVPVAAALLAAACSSASSSTAAAAPAAPASSAPAAASSSAPASASTTATVIKTATGSTGALLTSSTGRAVYVWSKDAMNKSACTGACAAAWPPVTTTGSVTAGSGVTASDLGTITRSGGVKQVTYDGHPLYYFKGDTGAGTTNGQGLNAFGAKWWLVSPAGSQITSADTVSSTSSSSGGGAAAPASTPAPAPASSSSAAGSWS